MLYEEPPLSIIEKYLIEQEIEYEEEEVDIEVIREEEEYLQHLIQLEPVGEMI